MAFGNRIKQIDHFIVLIEVRLQPIHLINDNYFFPSTTIKIPVLLG